MGTVVNIVGIMLWHSGCCTDRCWFQSFPTLLLWQPTKLSNMIWRSQSSDMITRSTPEPWFNIKMSYQSRKSHCGDKTILRPSYLHNGLSYTGKTTSLYWIGPQSSNRHRRQCEERKNVQPYVTQSTTPSPLPHHYIWPIGPCAISDLYLKFLENPFICIFVMFLIVTNPPPPLLPQVLCLFVCLFVLDKHLVV